MPASDAPSTLCHLYNSLRLIFRSLTIVNLKYFCDNFP